MKKLLILIALFTCFETHLEAQLLNRLKKGIMKGAEDAVVDKATEESYEQTSKAMDKMLENRMKNYPMSTGGNYISKDQLPPQYDFAWNYQMTMNSQNKEFVMDYFFKEGEKYFASISPQAMDMKIVFDWENEAYVTYMESEGEKMAMAVNMPEVIINEEDSVFNSSFTFKKTGNKKEILGYICEEFIGENDDYQFRMFVTHEAEVGFGDFFFKNQKSLPQGFDPEWLENGQGLMMEMEMIDKNKKKNYATMKCTKLEPNNFSLNNSEYEFMSN